MILTKRIIGKLKREYKYAFNELKSITGFNEKFYRNARGARIITYHGICIKDHLKFNNIFLTQETFEAHLQFYKKYFNILSPDDYYAQRFSNDKFNICISFDDGYLNNYKYVLPLLKAYKIPAVFFITAIREAGHDILWNDFLGIFTKYGPAKITYKKDAFWKDRFGKYVSAANGKSLVEIIRCGGFDLKKEMFRLLSVSTNFRENRNEEDYWMQMTPQQIKELSDSEFCTIGAHGYYHNDLAKISSEQAKEEMILTKKYLESVTGKKITALAFPYGTYTRQVVEDAKKAGYEKLLALDFHFSEDAGDTAMLERMIINPYISVANQMTAIIKNKYE